MCEWLEAVGAALAAGALFVSAVTLYVTSLRTAAIELTHVTSQEFPRLAPGQLEGPLQVGIECDLVAANVGARAGVLEPLTGFLDPDGAQGIWPKAPLRAPSTSKPGQPLGLEAGDAEHLRVYFGPATLSDVADEALRDALQHDTVTLKVAFSFIRTRGFAWTRRQERQQGSIVMDVPLAGLKGPLAVWWRHEKRRGDLADSIDSAGS